VPTLEALDRADGARPVDAIHIEPERPLDEGDARAAVPALQGPGGAGGAGCAGRQDGDRQQRRAPAAALRRGRA
jgi:hypothetical protein